MILIAEKINTKKLAHDHWIWLSKKIRYYDDEETLKKETESKTAQKNLALRDILGPAIYKNLEKIITKPLNDLINLKNDANYAVLFPPSREKLDKLKEALDIATADWQNKVNALKKINRKDPNKKILEAAKKHSNEVKKLKKKEFKTEQKAYKKDYKKYLKATTRTIKITEKTKDNKPKKFPTKIKVNLEDLLCYGKLHNSSDDWNANVLCDKLSVSVCPYCNRQYITVVKKNEDKWVSSAQIDHFLPKSLYPLFSCSFFNLIPSCYCCNHGKSNNTSITIHPYTEKFGDDGLFCLDYIENDNNIDSLDLDNPDHIILHIKIKPDSPLKEKIENSIDVFHLNDLYNAHHVEIKDFILRYRSFKKARLEDYGKLELDLSEKEMEDLLLGFPLGLGDAEYPFHKMRSDLYTQLKTAETTHP